MAALEPYGDFIRELFDTGKTHDAISTALTQSGVPKCSVMTARRFCVEHNLQRINLGSDLVSRSSTRRLRRRLHGKQ